jgi:hypothetical protein
MPPANFLQSATILANEGRGVSVYQSNATWQNFDTSAYLTWVNPHNSDSSWDLGALNANRNLSNPLDFGWGTYNMTTHNISGNKIYLVRISVGSGQTAVQHFKKLWVQELIKDSVWTFTYANIDNSDSNTVNINKSNYSNKLFENMEFFKAQKFAKQFQELKTEPLYVSEEDFDKLLKAIENPPEPNKKLKEGMKKHKEKFAQVQADIVAKEIARITDSFIAEEKSVDFVLAPDIKVIAEDTKKETTENDEDLWT